MWTMKETETLRQSLKMKLSCFDWYLGSYVVPDFEGYAIQVDVSKMLPVVWTTIPLRMRNTNIKIVVKNDNEQKVSS
jgi:hypothetical protein